MTDDRMRIHIVGAGGAGMSAIAKVLSGMGHVVTGSDIRGGSTLDRLADIGVLVHTGHNPEVVAAADLVVASSAVPESDPEVAAARESGIQVWGRPDLLEAVTRRIPTIGATGTHGKTTTTALIITALRALGQDPSFIVGGDISGLGTNGHFGRDDLLVIEADEAFRTFESLHLRGLVVTNVEPEHVEHFGDEESLLRSFADVAADVDGPVVACSDDPGSAEVARRADTATYGFSPEARWRIVSYDPGPERTAFVLQGPSGEHSVVVNRPGVHIARNSAGALALLGELDVDLLGAIEGLAEFRGIARRWEHRGTVGGVMLIDDYAHHPTEVAATLGGARGIVPGRVWAVFQPHLFSRTQRFYKDFASSLRAADVVVVTDVYGSREEPVPGVTGSLVAEALDELGAEVHYVHHRADLAEYVASRVVEGDLVITMGAGDITLLPGELAQMLAVARP